MLTAEQMAQRIEHTLLRPEAMPEDVDRLCDEACEFGFVGVCVNPIYVRRVSQRIGTAAAIGAGSPPSADDRSIAAIKAIPSPRIISVAGFPLGASLPETKADEARRAIDDGAEEIDMVVALGALLAGDRAAVRKDIETVAHAVHGAGRGKILKVILECAALTTEQIILGCQCAMEGEADYVKTSTGFHPAGGATVEHVRLLHRYGSPMRVKAAGGIRTAAAAQAMIEARGSADWHVLRISDPAGNNRPEIRSHILVVRPS